MRLVGASPVLIWRLVRVRNGTAAARSRAPQQTLDASFTREKFVFVPGDIVFLVAGVIEDDEDENNPDGFVDATEEWWALQITRPFERTKMRTRCQIHGFWLGRVARSSAEQWVLLQGKEVRLFYGAVIKTEQAQPVMINSSELVTGWSSSQQLTYTLPEELVARLDLLAVAAAAADEGGGAALEGEASEDEQGSDGGDDPDAAVPRGEPDTAVPQRDREAELARRGEARAAQLAATEARKEARVTRLPALRQRRRRAALRFWSSCRVTPLGRTSRLRHHAAQELERELLQLLERLVGL